MSNTIKTLLSPEQVDKFNSIKYGYNNCDYADYDGIQEVYQNMDIITSSWLSPHEDQECDHEDIFVFKVLHLETQPEGQEVCFVYTATDGSIKGAKLFVGNQYAFNFKKTHSVLPYDLAIKVFEKQSFDIPEVELFFEKFHDREFIDTAKIAYCFLDVKGSNFSL